MVALIVRVEYMPPAGDDLTDHVAFTLHPQYGNTGEEAHEALLRSFERAREVWYVLDQDGFAWSFLVETVAAFCVVDAAPNEHRSTEDNGTPEV